MLIVLGSAMIAVFMYLILAKRLAPTLALVLVPLTFALVATGTGLSEPGEDGVVDSISSAFSDFAPTAVLLFCAIIFFGTMSDVGRCSPVSSPSTATARPPSSSRCPRCCRSTCGSD
jgi:CitMHS family citrate-Mg2+:H+ or citrate-Ca2+:H+ symporter